MSLDGHSSSTHHTATLCHSHRCLHPIKLNLALWDGSVRHALSWPYTVTGASTVTDHYQGSLCYSQWKHLWERTTIFLLLASLSWEQDNCKYIQIFWVWCLYYTAELTVIKQIGGYPIYGHYKIYLHQTERVTMSQLMTLWEGVYRWRVLPGRITGWSSREWERETLRGPDQLSKWLPGQG